LTYDASTFGVTLDFFDSGATLVFFDSVGGARRFDAFAALGRGLTSQLVNLAVTWVNAQWHLFFLASRQDVGSTLQSRQDVGSTLASR
jgi:hypothetical protein